MILGLLFALAILALIGSYAMLFLHLKPPAKLADNEILQSQKFLWIAAITNLAAVVVVAPLAFYFGGRSKVASMASSMAF